MTQVRKIDSSSVGLAIAKEQSINKLPTNPVWQDLEPSEIGDVGGETTQTARSIINPSRQFSRGAITDLEASANFSQEISQNNTTDLMQGFLFADAHETFTTKPLNTAGVTVAVTTDTYTLSDTSFDTTYVLENSLLLAKDFVNTSNNGLKVVESVSSGAIGVTGAVAETSTSGSLQVVGYRASNVTIDVDGAVTLEFTGADSLGLSVGQWIFIGGDTNKPADNECVFARIGAIESNTITLDFTTKPLVAELNIATLDIFFGTVVHNEQDIDLIKRTTYTIEERLGFEDEERLIPQASYVTGCVPSEMTINLEQGALASAEYSFTGCRFLTKKGTLLTGDHKDAWNEKGYNNSNEVYYCGLTINSTDSEETNPAPMFAYVSSANISINNNLTANKSVATLGAFDISAGKFEVKVSPSVYFTSVDSIEALKNNTDCGFQLIVSHNNEGLIYDVPLIGLGSSIPSISDGDPIMMDLEGTGAKSKFGYTFAFNCFGYLPNIAMATEQNDF